MFTNNPFPTPSFSSSNGQFVQGSQYGIDLNDTESMMMTPSRKRRRLSGEPDNSPVIAGPNELPGLIAALERHLAESPVTRNLRKEIDYRVGVEPSRDGRGAEGIWKCLVCSSRPVTIALRNSGRQPQLSNVSTHLKTVKHTGALTQRGVNFLSAAAAVQSVQQPQHSQASEHTPAVIAGSCLWIVFCRVSD